MKYGDLSDEPAPGMGIRFERVIRTEDGKLNRAAKAYLQDVWRLDLNIYIITTGDKRKAMAFCVKWGVPYSHVVEASPLEIPLVCMENGFVYYFDLDKDIVQNVNARSSHTTKAEIFEGMDVADGSLERVYHNTSRRGKT